MESRKGMKIEPKVINLTSQTLNQYPEPLKILALTASKEAAVSLSLCVSVTILVAKCPGRRLGTREAVWGLEGDDGVLIGEDKRIMLRSCHV